MKARTLLGVWAHPDDEAYLSAGLMAEFRRHGDRVVVVMATLGEHGTDDPKSVPPRRLAAVRHRELRQSLAAVGVDELHLLGYEDGHCDLHDGTKVVGSHIAAIQPDLIVTFGPDGLTGHPDHRAVCRFTTQAWMATRSSAELWYATVTADFHERWGAVNDRVGFFADQPHPPCTEPHELASHRYLAEDLLDQKMAALEAHASQTGPFVDVLGRATYREWWRTESFRRAERPATLALDVLVSSGDRLVA